MFMTVKKVKQLINDERGRYAAEVADQSRIIDKLKRRVDYLESELGIKDKPIIKRNVTRRKRRTTRLDLLPSPTKLFESTGRTYMTRGDLNALMLRHGWKNSTAYRHMAEAVERQELIETSTGKLKLMKAKV